MNAITLNNYLSSTKRVKERSVGEAYEKVNRWKTILNEGLLQEDGTICRITLNKAAEIIGIPKKSLEDYNQLFKKVSLLTDINQFFNDKMGVLRNYLKKNQKKLKKEIKKVNENERKQKKYLPISNNDDEQHYQITSEKNLFKQDETSPIVSEQNFFQNIDTLYQSGYESNPSPLGMPISKKHYKQNSYIYSDEI